VSRRDDIVVFCHHGKNGADGNDAGGDFVQRFRWIDSEDAWVATDTGGDRVRYRGSRPGPYRDENDVAEAIGSGPPNFTLQCRRCSYQVTMAGVRAQRTLTKLSLEGLSKPSLSALRYVYERWKL